MITSFLVYPFMIFSMFMLFRVPVNCYNGRLLKARTNMMYWFHVAIGIFIFIFFTGVRWDVGIDQLSYWQIYNTLSLTDTFIRDDMEIGFVGFMKLLSKIGLSSTVFFAIVGLIQLCCTLTIFRREKFVIPFFCIGLICGGIFFSWCNGLRQQLVLSVFLCICSFFLLEKKVVPTLISIFLLTFFHRSAVFLFVLVPLMWIDLEKFFIKRKWQYLILFVALILSQFSVWENLSDYLDKLLVFVEYDDRYNSEVLMRVGSRTVNFGARRIIFLLFDILIIFYSNRMRQFYSSKIYYFVHALFLVLIFIQQLFMNSLAFSRFVDYFVIYRVIMLAYLMYYLFYIHSYMMGWVIILLLACHLSIQIIVDKGHHSDCVRYEFVWNR